MQDSLFEALEPVEAFGTGPLEVESLAPSGLVPGRFAN